MHSLLSALETWLEALPRDADSVSFKDYSDFFQSDDPLQAFREEHERAALELFSNLASHAHGFTIAEHLRQQLDDLLSTDFGPDFCAAVN